MNDASAREQRTFQVLMLVLVIGMAFAAYRAANWTDQSRARNFIVIAPVDTTMSIENGPAAVSTTRGVHTWSVKPGPLTLKIDFPDETTHRTKVIIPRGLGGLMLEVKQGPNGDLALGYF